MPYRVYDTGEFESQIMTFSSTAKKHLNKWQRTNADDLHLQVLVLVTTILF